MHVVLQYLNVYENHVSLILKFIPFKLMTFFLILSHFMYFRLFLDVGCSFGVHVNWTFTINI